MKKVILARKSNQAHWVGDGFPVRSLFNYNEDQTYLSPFLLLDHAAPYTFEPADRPRGVGRHPHRGFETVTIVYKGEVEHGDSIGNEGKIGEDEVQWMTAGSGIIHEEFHGHEFTERGGVMEMVQLWVNLPAKHKMTAPKYQEIAKADIPVVSLPNQSGVGRVIAGELLGERGPAKTFSKVNVWDLRLQKGTLDLPVPEGHNALVVVQDGEVTVGDRSGLDMGTLVILDREGRTFHLETDAEAKVLVLTGEPLNEPVVGQGPFVMNTQEELRIAFEDFRTGQFVR